MTRKQREALPHVGRWYLDERGPGIICDPSRDWQSVMPESRQDCEDLIALLERVRERLPP